MNAHSCVLKSVETSLKGICKPHDTGWITNLVALVDPCTSPMSVDNCLCIPYECKSWRDAGLSKQAHSCIHENRLVTSLKEIYKSHDTGWITNSVDLGDPCINPVSVDDYLCILHECKNRRDVDLAKQVHLRIHKNGLETHPNIGNHLIPMLVECGSVLEAHRVFDSMVYRNVHSWTSLIIGYIRKGELIRAIQLYEKMHADRVVPNSYTLVAILKACILLRDLQRGQEIHAYIVGIGFETEIIVGSTLIDMYSKVFSLLEAHNVCDKLPNKNVVAWSALIAGYAENDQGHPALKCFEQMLEEGVYPNPVTFIFVIKACGLAGAINKGRHIHTQIIYRGFEREIFVTNTLINMYSKSGLLQDAYNTFEKLPIKDIASWNAMIQGYSMNHDDGKVALGLFDSMHLHGVKPDAITFACVLSACGRANLVVKGRQIFKMMNEAHRISPMIDHFTCMVDLLARAGKLDEAEKLLESSPFSPPKDMWRALLSACIKYAEIGIGQRCIFRLGRSAPECQQIYVNAT